MALATLTLTAEAKITGAVTKTADLGDAKADHSSSHSTKYTIGTGTNQANQVFQDTRTLTATSEDLDLSGALTNKLGESVTFSKVKSIMIRNKNTTTLNVLKVGGAAATQLTGLFNNVNDIIIIGPGGCFFWDSPVDGVAVSGGSTDLLKIDAGAFTITYDITIIGVN